MPDYSLTKTFEITGTEKLREALAKWGDQGPSAIGVALYEAAENIATQAKRLTPVDTGALRSSAHVTPPEINGSILTVTIGYGGPAGSGNQGDTNSVDVGYAVLVHENLTAHHPVGQAKYLEQPVLEAMRTLEAELARRAQVILRERGLG